MPLVTFCVIVYGYAQFKIGLVTTMRRLHVYIRHKKDSRMRFCVDSIFKFIKATTVEQIQGVFLLCLYLQPTFLLHLPLLLGGEIIARMPKVGHAGV